MNFIRTWLCNNATLWLLEHKCNHGTLQLSYTRFMRKFLSDSETKKRLDQKCFPCEAKLKHYLIN